MRSWSGIVAQPSPRPRRRRRARGEARALAISRGSRRRSRGSGVSSTSAKTTAVKSRAATRDAGRADRYLTLGANRLRAAGQALGIRIGKLNGH